MKQIIKKQMNKKTAPEQMRVVRGYAIISKGDTPKQIDKETFIVPSQNGNGEYTITHNGKWECSCPDYQERHKNCKHIYAVKLYLGISDKIKEEGLEVEEVNEKPKCIYCDALDVVKMGKRKCRNIIKQRFRCNSCRRTFILDKDFERIKGNAEITTLILDLYFKGISLRGIQDHLKQFHNLSLDHSNILRRIQKYSKVINDYVKTLKPELSEQWHTDEMKIQAGGKWKWLWNVMDKETRYLITRKVSDKRRIKDSRNVLNQAKETAQKEPTFLITDGCVSYGRSIKRELKETNHIRLTSIRDKRINNNNIERLNGTIRDRIKVMRGMQNLETADLMTETYANYYNHIKIHSALGTTPAIASGIVGNLDGNRWLNLLMSSVKHNNGE